MSLATRTLTVTQGNLNNHHLYLTEVLDLFPEDVIGGPNREQAAPRTVRVLWGESTVETDIVRVKQIFRRRKWVRLFFASAGVREGDRILLEQLEPYKYRVSRLSPELLEYVALIGPDSEKIVPAPAPARHELTCPTCERVLREAGHAILSRGLGGAHWLKRPVVLCDDCHALLGQEPAYATRADRRRRTLVEGAVSFWFRCPPGVES